MLSKMKRFWIFLTCNHNNGLVKWCDSDGWNIMVCKRCARAWIFTDGANAEESMTRAMKRVDG